MADVESSPRIELLAAGREQEPILANLLELYIHDFSEYLPVEPRPDGRFGYPNLSLYWSEPDHHAFLIYVDGRLAGLVLVSRTPDSSGGHAPWDIAEFFVMRGFRRQHIGTKVAHDVWQRFPGQWQVRVMERNRPACVFWQRAIAEYPGGSASPKRTEMHGLPWLVFRLQSGPTELL
jgi:predicted acetyltransferase